MRFFLLYFVSSSQIWLVAFFLVFLSSIGKNAPSKRSIKQIRSLNVHCVLKNLIMMFYYQLSTCSGTV